MTKKSNIESGYIDESLVPIFKHKCKFKNIDKDTKQCIMCNKIIRRKNNEKS